MSHNTEPLFDLCYEMPNGQRGKHNYSGPYCVGLVTQETDWLRRSFPGVVVNVRLAR